MSLKVNDGGTWKEPTEVSVKDGSTWKKSKVVWVNDSGTWKKAYERLRTYTFTKAGAPTTDGSYGVYTDINLDDYFTSADKLWNCKVVIDSDVAIVASSTSAFALTTGSGYGGTLTIENNGYILGRGGNGGAGGTGYAS